MQFIVDIVFSPVGRRVGFNSLTLYYYSLPNFF